jgi:membrane protein DedA with SNARE-associated domain
MKEGIDGIVASPLEASAIRQLAGPDAILVTPGVRSRGSAKGDQKRVATPAEAIRDGANYIVVGRQVTRAADPAAALANIHDELREAWNLDHFLANYGYFAIFFLLMLGIVGPLIPDDSILVLSGVAVHRGELELGTTIAVAYAGSLCGITLSYALGRTGAIYVLERFPPIHRWIDKHLPQVEKWFERYGKWTLFFGYFIAGVRHFTALVAGMSKFEFRTFAVWAWPGGLVWVVCFVSIGYYMGAEWEHVAQYLDKGTLIAAGLIAGLGVAGWWIRRRSQID